MDPRRKQLLDRIAQARAKRPCRYGAALKRDIVAYAESRRGSGAKIRDVADELGLNAIILGNWLRHADRRRKVGKPPFEPISGTEPHTNRVQPETASTAARRDEPLRAPNGRKRRTRGSARRPKLWLVALAEHVYMTDKMPKGLKRVVDKPTNGAEGSA